MNPNHHHNSKTLTHNPRILKATQWWVNPPARQERAAAPRPRPFRCRTGPKLQEARNLVPDHMDLELLIPSHFRPFCPAQQAPGKEEQGALPRADPNSSRSRSLHGGWTCLFTSLCVLYPRILFSRPYTFKNYLINIFSLYLNPEGVQRAPLCACSFRVFPSSLRTRRGRHHSWL